MRLGRVPAGTELPPPSTNRNMKQEDAHHGDDGPMPCTVTHETGREQSFVCRGTGKDGRPISLLVPAGFQQTLRSVPGAAAAPSPEQTGLRLHAGPAVPRAQCSGPGGSPCSPWEPWTRRPWPPCSPARRVPAGCGPRSPTARRGSGRPGHCTPCISVERRDTGLPETKGQVGTPGTGLCHARRFPPASANRAETAGRD